MSDMNSHLFDLDAVMMAASSEEAVSSHVMFNGASAIGACGGHVDSMATSSSPTKSFDSSNEQSSPEKKHMGKTHHFHLRSHRNTDQDADQNVAKLFVGNLPTTTTLPELLSVFRQYGPINERLSVVKDHNYAFIHFFNRKDAERALIEVNDSLFKDRYIRVQFSTSQGFSKKPKNKSFSSAGSDVDETQYKAPSNDVKCSNHVQTSSLLNSKTGFKSMYDFQTTNSLIHQAPSYRPITGGNSGSRGMSHSNTTMFNQYNHKITASTQMSSWPTMPATQSVTSPTDLSTKKQHQIIQAFYMKQEQRQKQEQQQLIQQQLLYQQLMNSNSNMMIRQQSQSSLFDPLSDKTFWPNMMNKFK